MNKTATATPPAPPLRRSPRGKGESGPTILLRSSWQTCNIGDIAHTLGVGQLIRQRLPEARIILWPNDLEPPVLAMIRRELPEMEILDRHDRGQIDGAIDRADLFLHGSAPGVVARAEIEYWLSRCDKPFGLLGVTVENPSPDLVRLLDRAAFIYTRETESLEHLRREGCTCPVQEFAPDGVFAMDIRNEAAAEALCATHGLEPGRFICAIPRLRYSPYHLFRKVDWSAEKIRHVTETNERHQFADHARLREPIIRWVRETGQKVLVCPEMSYVVDIMDPLVIDPLPDDVRPNVVAQREYWLPDVAQAVYQRAAGVVSMECHSPIMALAVRTPSMYLRLREDTIKGQMYHDLGLSRWVFEVDHADPAAVADRAMEMTSEAGAAQASIDAMLARCDERHRAAIEVIAATCGRRV